MSSRSFDAIVIDGGLHGLSAALHLAKEGLSPLVLGKDHPGRHALGVNAGGVRRLGRHLAEVPLYAQRRGSGAWLQAVATGRRSLTDAQERAEATPDPSLRPHRIHAHVALTVFALLLEQMAEQACNDTWRNILDDLKPKKLAQLSSPNGTIWQVTELTPTATKQLKSLQIDDPPPLLDVR